MHPVPRNRSKGGISKAVEPQEPDGGSARRRADGPGPAFAHHDRRPGGHAVR